jgi:hypothetical protein
VDNPGTHFYEMSTEESHRDEASERQGSKEEVGSSTKISIAFLFDSNKKESTNQES